MLKESLLVIFMTISVANACETKTIYLPDGKIQVCQVCKDSVICY